MEFADVELLQSQVKTLQTTMNTIANELDWARFRSQPVIVAKLEIALDCVKQSREAILNELEEKHQVFLRD